MPTKQTYSTELIPKKYLNQLMLLLPLIPYIDDIREKLESYNLRIEDSTLKGRITV